VAYFYVGISLTCHRLYSDRYKKRFTNVSEETNNK